MLTPSATIEATAAFAGRFPTNCANHFYRQAQGLTVSTLGIGTYLGAMDDATDIAYQSAIQTAIEGGINFIDTSLNYRNQRSELAIGRALKEGGYSRGELVLCTKAGYLTPEALAVGLLRAADVVGNMHSMAPAFLQDQLQRSLTNLGVECVDVFYLHNPETQLQFVDAAAFYTRIRQAFEALEAQVAAGRIRFYGTATWNGYRVNGGARSLSLVRLESVAREVAGAAHHFRFIQLPFNLSMTEGLGQKCEQIAERRLSVLEAAGVLGITAVASASLLQAKLASGLPEALGAGMPGALDDADRAIQFSRSAPGITVTLVGMSRAAHVVQNLRAASYAPLSAERFRTLLS